MAKAFTILELIIVIAIVAVLAAVGWPSLTRYQGSGRIQTGAEQAADFLRIANQSAVSGLANSAYGVKFFSNRAVLFKGVSFSERDQLFDQQIFFDRGLSLNWLLARLATADQLTFTDNNIAGNVPFAELEYSLKFYNRLSANYMADAQRGGVPVDEIVFSKNTGYPNASGFVNLVSSDGSRRQLIINQLGLAELLNP
ncbi:MAG: type II secretion system protein [Candidatus Falkowbacteria bacterium]